LFAWTQSATKSAFFQQHILGVKQFSRNELHILFGVAQEMRTLVERQRPTTLLAGKVMANAFFEPSTRTSASFETAMVRLGGQVVNVNQITSSTAKGESLADTGSVELIDDTSQATMVLMNLVGNFLVRTLGCYADVLVMRHPEPGSSQVAAKYAKIPVINAGDGIGEHPTQVRFLWDHCLV
jgi:carbamoyl-phosphate synthase/aspartate carbamoyltransferase